jgi:hypothetical protein
MRSRFVSTLTAAAAIGVPVGSAWAQPSLPEVTGVELRAVVEEDETDASVFRFSYRIANTAGSLPVDTFSLDLRSDPSREPVSKDGLADAPGAVLPSSQQYELGFGPEGLVASAFPSVPNAWLTGIDAQGRARWSTADDSEQVSVGATKDGFTLLSRALPGVREARLETDLFPFLPNVEEVEDLDAVTAAADSAGQLATSVGPVAPPKDLDLAAFAGEIGGHVTTSEQEGWIRDASLAAGLSGQLAALQVALAAGDDSAAKGLAKAFIDEVDANACTTFTCPGDPAITSEGFALLHFNMVFLRSNIPNTAPVCDAAEASPNLFWPPNHGLVDVEVSNVSDPDGDPLVISFQSVLSDEAVDQGGSGNTCPDAVILPDGRLQLRAERSGKLDGRVYEVHYTATDTADASCGGTVRVCTPHDESETATCSEGALDFAATTCP